MTLPCFVWEGRLCELCVGGGVGEGTVRVVGGWGEGL